MTTEVSAKSRKDRQRPPVVLLGSLVASEMRGQELAEVSEIPAWTRWSPRVTVAASTNSVSTASAWFTVAHKGTAVSHLQRGHQKAGGMDSQLRALASLPPLEPTQLRFSAPTRQLTIYCNFNSRESNAILWPL